MKQTLLKKALLGALFFSFFNGFAQDKQLPEFRTIASVQQRMPALDTQFKAYKRIQFPVSQLADFVKGKTKTEFLLNLGTDLVWDLALEPSGLVAKDYKLTLQTENGLQTIYSKPDYLYKGKILGGKIGNVRLAIKKGFIYGSINVNDREWMIEPASRYNRHSSKDEYLIYETKDVIARNPLPCGVSDEANNINLPVNANRDPIQARPFAECKRIRVLQVTDFQMLEKFQLNIDSLQTFLLANMNATEGVYTGLNFDPDDSTDVGKDKIRFEIFETVISTCQSCDVLSKGNNSTELNGVARKWLQNNYSTAGYFISQFWSPRRLYSGSLSIVGEANGVPSADNCKRLPFQLLSYYTDNAVALRFMTAHETGHNLGASHDNEFVRSMTQFFMNSYTVLSATRFSTLRDYNGFKLPGTNELYSSQLVFRNFSFNYSDCIDSCSGLAIRCDTVRNVSTQYYNSPDSIKLSWEGSGIFFIKVKEKQAENLVTKDSFVTNGNTTVIKQLLPCVNYFATIQKICTDADTSAGVTVSFSSTDINVQDYQVINERSDRYDLQLKIAHSHNSSGQFYVFVDHKSQNFNFEKSPQTIKINDLFADGARHRLDIRQLINGSSCNKTFFYNAPYYRKNSIVLLKNDFNDSCKLAGWKDSVMEAKGPLTGKPFNVGLENKGNLFFDTGSFDSTCFAYYNNIPLKKLALTSPKADVSRYNNIMLSFDYQYWINYRSIAIANAFFGVEIFDGAQWKNLLRQNLGLAYNDQKLNKPIWDTLPQRRFLELDSFKNNQLQIRFVLDKGIDTTDGFSNWLFLALDNIRVDAFNNPWNEEELNYVIYPNPSEREIFVVFDRTTPNDLNYRITDISGRLVRKDKIINSRVQVYYLPKGVYLFQLYKGSEAIGKAKKLLKL